MDEKTQAHFVIVGPSKAHLVDDLKLANNPFQKKPKKPVKNDKKKFSFRRWRNTFVTRAQFDRAAQAQKLSKHTQIKLIRVSLPPKLPYHVYNS